MSTTYEQENAADPLEAIPTLPEEAGRRREVLLRAADECVETGRCFLVAVCIGIDGELFGRSGSSLEEAADLMGYGGNWIDIARFSDNLIMETDDFYGAHAAILRRMANGATWEEATS